MRRADTPPPSVHAYSDSINAEYFAQQIYSIWLRSEATWKRSMNYGWYFVQTSADTSVLRRRRRNVCETGEVHKSKWIFHRFKNTQDEIVDSRRIGIVTRVVRRMQLEHCMSLLRLFVCHQTATKRTDFHYFSYPKSKTHKLFAGAFIGWQHGAAASLAHANTHTHRHIRHGERPHGMISFDRQCLENGEVRSIRIGHGIVDNLVQLTQIWLLN